MLALIVTPFWLVTLILPALVSAGVPMPRYEALMKQQSQELGLYNSSDKVIILTAVNFKDMVIQQNHSMLVEFYNSYCGHCKRFAPKYKELAEQLQPWRDVLKVCAIDCAVEENNGICREYEVMEYPSMRYFGPGFHPSASNYGRKVETQKLDEIRLVLVQWLVAENRTDNMTSWPNLQNLSESDAKSLLEGRGNQRQYVALVYEPENTTLGVETILHFLRWPSIEIIRVADLEVAGKFQIDGSHYKIATIDKQGTIVPYTPLAETVTAYVETIESFLRAEHITELPIEGESDHQNTSNDAETKQQQEQVKINKVVIAEVRQNKHFVYQTDLEMAIRGILFNEVPKLPNITGDRLLALQRFLAVIKRYNPLGSNGRSFISKLHEYVMQNNQSIMGKSFQEEVIRLEALFSPVLSVTNFVGCSGSRPDLRGFTCSVWQLFHFMTVQATHNEASQDPIEVLQAMHGYVKYFFGCTDCAQHFQSMAATRKIWSTPNKDEAVLWLWAAHNEVNQRLAGDSTEDPQFPKIQFPSQSSCSQCYRQPIMSPANLDISWNKDAVLNFLKNIHNPEYVSRYGIDYGGSLNPTLENMRQKRMITNVFSDMDMHMGLLLYGFCIVMMVIAFKLFVFKGYRRKSYGHDMLGKV